MRKWIAMLLFLIIGCGQMTVEECEAQYKVCFEDNFDRTLKPYLQMTEKMEPEDPCHLDGETWVCDLDLVEPIPDEVSRPYFDGLNACRDERDECLDQIDR